MDIIALTIQVVFLRQSLMELLAALTVTLPKGLFSTAILIIANVLQVFYYNKISAKRSVVTAKYLQVSAMMEIWMMETGVQVFAKLSQITTVHTMALVLQFVYLLA